MENLTGGTPPVRPLLCVVPCKLYFTSAKISGLSREAYIRKLILGETVKAKPPQELAELLRLLKSASDNINQIARVSNARHFVRSDELAEIYSKLDDIWGKIKEL